MTRLELDSVPSLVRHGMRIGLGGFWFVRTPMALAEKVLESGARDLEIVCFGGGLAVERLVASGRVRTLYFSFHSMDVIGAASRFGSAVEAGKLSAVELTTQVMGKALQAAQENLPFLPVRGPLESGFLEGDYPLPPLDCPVTGTRLHAVPALPLDLALVHATSSDVDGNVEIVGARGLDRRILGAAKVRVVTVEEVAGEFRGPVEAHRTTIPRFLVDHIVECPGAARPSSCLPHYDTDFDAIRRELGVLPPDDPENGAVTTVAPKPEPAALSSGRAGARARPDESPPTRAEIVVFHLARQLRDGGIYTVGSVTPVSMVAYQLAKQTHAPTLAVIPFAGLVDVRPYPVGVASAERKALRVATAFWGMDDLYEQLYEAGRIDAEIFCPAQIDELANINNSLVRDGGAGVIRLPGQAGIADVATLHKNLYMYVPRHSPRRFVRRVDFRGGTRALVTDAERAAAGLSGGETTVVTNLCVLRLDKRVRRFRLESLHPGVEVTDVLEQTGFPLLVDDSIAPSAMPDADVLALLRHEVDPMGVRDLETVASSARAALLQRILESERSGDDWKT